MRKCCHRRGKKPMERSIFNNYKPIHARCDQKITIIFSKNIYLFIKNYLVPLKVIPLRYNTLMPAFFPILEALLKRHFWHCQQLLFRFFFYIHNRSITLSFHRCLLFWKKEKVIGGQVW